MQSYLPTTLHIFDANSNKLKNLRKAQKALILIPTDDITSLTSLAYKFNFSAIFRFDSENTPHCPFFGVSKL